MKTKHDILNIVVKSIVGICLRLILLFAILFTIVLVIDKALYKIEENKNKESAVIKEKQDMLTWHNYSIVQTINRLNENKLIPGYWNYEARDYTIIKKGETIQDKGDKKRILVVGDSFVWGWAHDNMNNVWWKQLDYIIKQNGYQNIDIVAAGMNGFSIVDETEKIILNKEYIEKINPDLIIVGFVSNDWEIMDEKDEYFVRDVTIDEDKYKEQYFNIKSFEFFEKNFSNIYDKIVDLVLKKEYAKEEFKENYGYTHKQKKILYHTDDYMERIRDRAIQPLSKVNIPLVVVNLHYESEIGNSSFQFKENVFKLLDEFHVENYDLQKEYKKEFKDISYEDLQVNTEDFHPGTRLMNFYAERIYNYLEKYHNKILGEKSNVNDEQFEINDYLPYSINLQKIKDKMYKFQYSANMKTLYYYNYEKYIKLNLQSPVHVKKIILETPELSDPKITVDLYNENLGYEDKRNVKIALEKLENNKYIYTLNVDEKVTAINISVSLKNKKNTEVILEVE